MPIYEYECEKCHHHLEALQKILDKPLRECPECGRHKLKRLVSAPMFRLSGSGWYETDFKSDKETKRNLAGKDEAPAADGAAADKADQPAKLDKSDKVDKADTKVDKKPEVATPKARTSSSKPAARPVASSKPVARKPATKKTARKR